jgi:hypothetical protein
MTRALLVALTLSAACGPATKPPPSGNDFDPDTDRPPPGGDSVETWAGKMSARVPLVAARDLPPSVVKALIELLPPPESLAPNRLLWARPLTDQAGLVAFAAERQAARQSGGREGVITHALASTSGGTFTLIGSSSETWTGAGGSSNREIATRDLDGDGTLDLIVERDQRLGDRGLLGLAVFFSASSYVALVDYRTRDEAAELTPEYACAGSIDGVGAVVIVTRTAASADGQLIGDRFPNVWLPDDKGRYTPTVVWGHELGTANDPAALVGAWRKLAGAKAVPDAVVDEDGRLVEVPDCGTGTPVIGGRSILDADHKVIPGKPYHLINGLTRDRAAAEKAAGGKRLIQVGVAELN